MKLRHSFICLSFLMALASPLPVQAALQRSADFSQGSTIGVGLFGLGYDYGLGPFSLGLTATTPLPNLSNLAFGSYSMHASSSFTGYQPYLKLSTRALWRLFESDGLSAGFLVGLEYDPGSPGSRSWLTPDVGFSMAYGFEFWELPMALRLNVTIAPARTSAYLDSDTNLPPRTFLQQLSIGPNTSLELAVKPNDNLEITLGGGTLLGMRLHFQ